jgi:hypothetical protein
MMADFMFNVAKGRHAYYAMLPAADDSLIVVPIETTDIVGDSTMEDYATLDALLAGASNEQTTMGRKTLASVTSTVDNTNDLVKVDAADVVWTAATGNDISALVVCYKPTAASADSAVIPLYKYDFVIEVDGSDVTAVINTDGLAEAE